MSTLSTIEWSPAFSVGVALLDDQHRQIIKMINQLLSDPDLHVRSETISDLLTKMTDFAEEHFRTEEKLLTEHDYPGLAAQKE